MRKVKNIVIVGGGTSGWIAAAYYLRQVPDINLTLIESPNIPIVGVGEATILGFDDFLNNCGIHPSEWMAATDATYKCGILYPGWRDEKTVVWHPFNTTRTRQEYEELSDIELWHNIQDKTLYDYNTYALDDWTTCVLKNKVSNANIRKGYHLDCIKLANFLSKKCMPKINYKQTNVKQVKVNDHGIEYLLLDNDEKVTADLYIDCTGFKRLLSSSLPDSQWVDKSSMLLLNSAVAGQIAYKDQESGMRPYTIAQAVDHGWIWKIPIQGRIGSGLVYDSSLLSPAEAEEQFVNHWGADRIISSSLNHIKFKPEYNKKNWRHNCLSIGLASGFIEPLESTGLQLMIDGIVNSSDLVKKGFYTQDDVDCFNSIISIRYDTAMDFIGLHYLNNQRTGLFWKKVQEYNQPTDTLLATIEQFKYKRQWFVQQSDKHLFGTHNKHIWMDAVGIDYAVKQVPEKSARFMLEDSFNKNKKTAYMTTMTNFEIAKMRSFNKI